MRKKKQFLKWKSSIRLPKSSQIYFHGMLFFCSSADQSAIYSQVWSASKLKTQLLKF